MLQYSENLTQQESEKCVLWWSIVTTIPSGIFGKSATRRLRGTVKKKKKLIQPQMSRNSGMKSYTVHKYGCVSSISVSECSQERRKEQEKNRPSCVVRFGQPVRKKRTQQNKRQQPERGSKKEDRQRTSQTTPSARGTALAARTAERERQSAILLQIAMRGKYAREMESTGMSISQGNGGKSQPFEKRKKKCNNNNHKHFRRKCI